VTSACSDQLVAGKAHYVGCWALPSAWVCGRQAGVLVFGHALYCDMQLCAWAGNPTITIACMANQSVP
jgi:hypothetical protein